MKNATVFMLHTPKISTEKSEKTWDLTDVIN